MLLEEKIFAGAAIAYVVGVPIAFGMMVKAIGPFAIFLSIIWPATGLAYLGYMVTL